MPTLRPWQRPAPLALAALGIAAIASVVVWSLTRPGAPHVVRFPIPLAADQDFSFTGRPMVAISPDGSHLVYTANRSLWLRPVDQLQATQVPGTEEEARAPFFSADGQSIGFWADAQLKKVSVSGGAPVTLADGVSNPFGASWGAHDMILYGQPEGIMQVPGASGTPALLIPVDEREVMHRPQMLPGGEWVLFTVRDGPGNWDAAQIVTQSVTTGERTVLIDGGRDGRYLATGHLVYGLNNVLFAVPFDVGSRQVTGGPVPLVEGVRPGTASSNGTVQFSVSATGSLVYLPDTGGSVDEVGFAWVDLEGQDNAVDVPEADYEEARV